MGPNPPDTACHIQLVDTKQKAIRLQGKVGLQCHAAYGKVHLVKYYIISIQGDQ